MNNETTPSPTRVPLPSTPQEEIARLHARIAQLEANQNQGAADAQQVVQAMEEYAQDTSERIKEARQEQAQDEDEVRAMRNEMAQMLRKIDLLSGNQAPAMPWEAKRQPPKLEWKPTMMNPESYLKFVKLTFEDIRPPPTDAEKVRWAYRAMYEANETWHEPLDPATTSWAEFVTAFTNHYCSTRAKAAALSTLIEMKLEDDDDFKDTLMTFAALARRTPISDLERKLTLLLLTARRTELARTVRDSLKGDDSFDAIVHELVALPKAMGEMVMPEPKAKRKPSGYKGKKFFKGGKGPTNYGPPANKGNPWPQSKKAQAIINI